MRLKDKVAIVTGAARGIGEGIAERFAEEGARLVLNDVGEAELNAVVSRLVGRGVQAVAVAGSVAAREVVQRMVDTAVQRFGTLDIIVNNAGNTRDAMLHKMTDAQWTQVMDVNLTGVFLGIQCAALVMREKGYGRIVNISSTSALGNTGQINYAASKAGVIGMTRTAAKELGPKGITVNALAPGAIWTDMLTSMPPHAVKSLEAKLAETAPLKKRGMPIDVANAALYFASDESAYVTGQCLFVDGGMKV